MVTSVTNTRHLLTVKRGRKHGRPGLTPEYPVPFNRAANPNHPCFPQDGDFDLDLDNKAYTPPRCRFAPKINPAQMEHGYREHVDESRNIRGLTSNGAWNANRTQANQERRPGC